MVTGHTVEQQRLGQLLDPVRRFRHLSEFHIRTDHWHNHPVNRPDLGHFSITRVLIVSYTHDRNA